MDENKTSWFGGLSKFEKIFWATILVLLAVYLALEFMASRHFYQDRSREKSDTASKELYKEIEIVVDSARVRLNLENDRTMQAILSNLDETSLDINRTVDRETEKLFAVAYGNVESFLDFHYSVIGEYVELGSMAGGKIEEHIEEKLFGKRFIESTDETLGAIAAAYHARLDAHLEFITSQAQKGVDVTLNIETFSRLKADIRHNILIQQGKIATLMAAAIAAKIAKTVAAKIAIKQASKISAKVASKAAIKGAAAASGAGAGVMCGPLVWVCSPVAAAAMWFGTDTAVVNIDEHFNRDEFRRDIIASLDKQKQSLSLQLKQDYTKALRTISADTVKRYKETNTKEKKKVRIKELITK